jgi:hypothetical protein
MADTTQDIVTAQYSYAVRTKKVVDIPFPMAVDYTYNSFWRDAYNRAAEGIADQARALRQRGNISMEEVRQLVEVQRNGLVIELRKPLTPFGKIYSEIIKPARSLPTLDQLLRQKGSVELVLESAGKTRAAVNRISFVAKRAGTAGIVLEIVLTAVVIELAPADQRRAVAAKQIGGIVGAVSFGSAGGWAGAWAGATLFVAAGSPTLVIPVVGEIAEAGCAVIGGAIGFFAFGWLGQKAGERAGSNVWSLLRAYWH